MTWSVFTLLCDHRHHPFQNLFGFSQTETLCPWNTGSPSLPSPSHCSSFWLWEFEGTSHKRTETVFVLFWVDYFTSHDAVKVRVCCSVWQHFLPFLGWTRFHCPDRPQSSTSEHLSCSHLLGLMDNVATTWVCEHVWVPAFNYFVCDPRSECP